MGYAVYYDDFERGGRSLGKIAGDLVENGARVHRLRTGYYGSNYQKKNPWMWMSLMRYKKDTHDTKNDWFTKKRKRYDKIIEKAEWVRDSKKRQRRLIAPTPEHPLVECHKLSSTMETETQAIAESSYVPALLFVALALLVGYLFFRCVKARRRARPLAYPRGLLGGEA